MNTSSVLKSTCFFLCFSLVTVFTVAQTSPHSSESDPGKQAFVIDSMHTDLRFEPDGTGAKRQTARIRIQSEAGVKVFGTVRVGYNSAFEKVDVEYVRVTKPDGTKLTADTSAIQDLAAEIQRIAPQYSDFREKHINVPGLRPGDLLEYSIATKITAAMIPGQFFVDYEFQKSTITRDEELSIDVPAERALKTKFAKGFEPTVRTENGRKIYAWTRANNSIKEPEENGEDETSDEILDVQISTFQSWGEVAKWYADLERPRLEVNDAVRAKATELTKGLTTDEQKIEAIYNYVATNVRYLGLSFGLGRYQPHAASEVLVDQYGDCKDKETLTASLLAAVGIKADAVLIHSSRKLDEDVPSPSQFDHLIGVVTTAQGDEYLDTTVEVAPIGFLANPLRGKRALRVKSTGEGVLVKMPTDSPYPEKEVTEIEASLNEKGDLEGDVTHTAQGGPALIWRALLRATAEAQWDQLMKNVLATADLKPEVTNVTATPIPELQKPLVVKYHFVQKQYLNLARHDDQLKLPMIPLNVRPAATPEQRKDPIRIGKQDITIKLKLKLPSNITVVAPSVTVKSEDFADFRANYSFEGHELTAERTFRMKVDEIPRKRYLDYNQVYEGISGDQEQKATLMYKMLSNSVQVAKKSALKEKTLPGNSDSANLVKTAKAAIQARDIGQAQQVLESAVKSNPQDAEAWSLLGNIYLIKRALDSSYGDKAIIAYRKQAEIDPKSGGWKQLGMAYFLMGKYSDAADAMAKQSEMTPEDPSISGMLGNALLMAKRPKEAIAPLEKAVASGTKDASTPVFLAKAYYLAGEKEKGDEKINSMLTGEVSPQQRASVAEILAEVNQSPDLAEQQIQMALSDAYSQLQSTDIKLADEPELQRAWRMAKIWESAGWVYFQHGNLPRARQYLEAAWAWSPQIQAGDRLAQLYQKQGRNDDAIRIWAQAMSTQTIEHPDVRQHFVEAVGNADLPDRLTAQHRLDLQEMRTLDVENPQKISGTAEFYILVGNGSKIEDVDFYNGDEKVKELSTHLKQARLELPMPDEEPIHILRTGILSCYSLSPTCKFVLTPGPSMLMMGGRF
ncbi:MAG TPA: DUF3857 domain-containing protein [Terriglobales bacterium]|nr:DUF3857 domain-containing protein [Terriglobales bacterium]